MIEPDDKSCSDPRDGASQQIRFSDNHLNKFSLAGELFSETFLFVESVSRVQKLIYFILTENGFDFGGGQALTRIVVLNNFIVVGDFAQETPRVATGRSGAFEPEFYDCHSVLWKIQSLRRMSIASEEKAYKFIQCKSEAESMIH